MFGFDFLLGYTLGSASSGSTGESMTFREIARLFLALIAVLSALCFVLMMMLPVECINTGSGPIGDAFNRLYGMFCGSHTLMKIIFASGFFGAFVGLILLSISRKSTE